MKVAESATAGARGCWWGVAWHQRQWRPWTSFQHSRPQKVPTISGQSLNRYFDFFTIFFKGTCFLAGSDESEPLLSQNRQQCLRSACFAQRIPAPTHLVGIPRPRRARTPNAQKRQWLRILYVRKRSFSVLIRFVCSVLKWWPVVFVFEGFRRSRRPAIFSICCV